MAEKILIVDDDRDTLKLVGLLLQRKGYQIVAADNGIHALEKAQEEYPDLILLDVMMPDMDGIEVLRRLRASNNTSKIPVIMFTAKTQVEDKVVGFEAGADDYLTKPTHPAELTARVRTILARTAARKQDASSGQDKSPRKTEKGKIIGVLSTKGGVGVTTVALNTAIVLHQATKKNVILGEFRPGEGELSLNLGFQEQTSQSTLLAKDSKGISRNDIIPTLIEHESGIRLMMSSYQPGDARFITAADQFAVIAEHLSYLAHYTILDLGPALTPVSDKAIEKCDQLIVVIEPLPHNLVKTKLLLEDLSMKVLGLGRIHVVQLNRQKLENPLPLREIQNRLGHNLAAVISPMPELALQATMQNVPMVLLQQAGIVLQQYQKLAEAAVKAG